MIRIYFISLFLLFVCFVLQANTVSPKREMRATWLTTVWRIDWPSVTVPVATGTNEVARQAAINQQKNDLIRIFDGLKAANMNAAFFQIRSMSDAMYRSSFEPWSSFISAQRGSDPGWDPLAFAIEEAHKRGIELHAWINPYRYSTSQATHGELPTDYFHTNPEWLLAYDSFNKILNPGLPEVVQQIKKIVGEVVNNYNVDGIIFDDYFYSYGGTSNTLDQRAQDLHRPPGKSIADWRRENVNRMIAAVYDTIQKVKPWVTFGVSPFGTWTTNQTVAQQRGVPLPVGLGTTADMYSQIYCDPVAWLEEGTVDYVSPQLYWTTFSPFSFGILSPWWSNLSNRFGRHFYASHSLTAMTSGMGAPPAPQNLIINNEEVPWQGISMIERSAFNRSQVNAQQRAPAAIDFAASEIGLQIDFNRTSDINDAPGSVFFATSRFMNTTGFINYLRTSKFTHQALPPNIGWKRAEPQGLVQNIAVTGQLVSWTYTQPNVRFAVYAVPQALRNDPKTYRHQTHLLGLSYSTTFTLPQGINSTTHSIAVAVVDRFGNEYAPRILGESTSSGTAVTLTFPANNADALLPTFFRWNEQPAASGYLWQLATDAQFNHLVCTRETSEPRFNSSLQTNIQNNTQYFWRVQAIVPNQLGVWSETRQFSGHKFRISSPSTGSMQVSLTPTIEWDSVSPTATYTLEIATAADFSAARRILLQTINTHRFTVAPNLLLSNTLYFARVTVTDGPIQAITETVSFTTEQLFIPVPVIVSPLNNSVVSGRNIQVCWQPQTSNGFRIELSRDATFPGRATTVRTTDALTFCTTFENLSTGVYFVRLRALRTTDMTNTSEVVSITLDPLSNISNLLDEHMYCIVDRQSGNSVIRIVSEHTRTLHISVFTLTGALVSQTVSHQNLHHLIPMSPMTKGVFTVVVNDGHQSRHFKVIL